MEAQHSKEAQVVLSRTVASDSLPLLVFSSRNVDIECREAIFWTIETKTKVLR